MNRPRVQASVGISHLALSALTLIAVILTACNLRAQPASPMPEVAKSAENQAAVSSQPSAQRPLATPGDELSQMRTDLDRIESLLGNMSSEIEFLRDQNLQILLRSNAQMWTILIRDLRRQIGREEELRSRILQPESGSSAPKPPH